MAITTLAGAIAGMKMPCNFTKVATATGVVGRPQSLFYLAGNPPAAAAPSPGIGGAVLTTYAGQIPWINPASGNSYLARLQAIAGAGTYGSLMLCDRLWHNSGITITSTGEQTFTGAAQIPARDENGSNAGVGVYGAIEVSGATGAGTPTLTLKYTNSAGTADKTATNINATVASSAIGAFYPIALAEGDDGIQKAQSLTLSETWTSGTIHAVLYRVLARLELPMWNLTYALDALTGGFPRLYDNTVPFILFVPAATSYTQIAGQMIVSQG